MENNMTQEGTVTISLQQYLDLKNFYEETIKNKVGLYTGEHYFGGDWNTPRFIYASATFITTDEAILKIEKYNTKLKEDFDHLALQHHKLMEKSQAPLKRQESSSIIPNTNKNIFSKLFNLFKK